MLRALGMSDAGSTPDERMTTVIDAIRRLVDRPVELVRGLRAARPYERMLPMTPTTV